MGKISFKTVKPFALVTPFPVVQRWFHAVVLIGIDGSHLYLTRTAISKQQF
jgi:hypothetical protein